MFDIMYLFSLIIIHRLRLIEDMGQHLIQKITIIEILIRKSTNTSKLQELKYILMIFTKYPILRLRTQRNKNNMDMID